jgi:hypothetical protein
LPPRSSAARSRRRQSGRVWDENEEVLATVPTFPGAARIEVESSAYRGADGEGDPLGFITLHRFRLPEEASRVEVARFYKSRLRGWLLKEELVEARGERVLNFCREDATLSVNLENAELLELAVDHDAFGKYGHSNSCNAALHAKRDGSS